MSSLASLPSRVMPRTSAAMVLLLASCLLSSPAVAEQRYYDVEMIAFKWEGDAPEEYWPAEPDLPAREETAGSLTHGAARLGIKILPRPEWRLGPVAYTLRKRGLQTVFHLAWRQAVPQRGSASWLWIETGELSGRIRVTRGRYLHVDTDLLLTEPGAAQGFRVVGSRRMRSTELHHLDHPKLGILVRADPYEPPAAAAAPTTETAAPNADAAAPIADAATADEAAGKR